MVHSVKTHKKFAPAGVASTVTHFHHLFQVTGGLSLVGLSNIKKGLVRDKLSDPGVVPFPRHTGVELGQDEFCACPSVLTSIAGARRILEEEEEEEEDVSKICLCDKRIY